MNITELRSKIKEASDAYYNGDESIITDAEFDALKDELKLLSPDDPILYDVGAPVDNSHWEKYTHKIAMGSLNKVNTVDEFKKWHNNCGNGALTISEKLDGCSVSLDYVDGYLEHCASRGDGIIGEEITRNVINMKNVKRELSQKVTLSLRGEIIMVQDDFDKLNSILEKQGDKPFKNKRNAASGIAKRIDGKYSEYLSVVYYDCTLPMHTASDRFDVIKALGLPTSLIKSNCSVDDCINIYNEYEDTKRVKLTYDIDGVVIEVDDTNKKITLGELYGNSKGSIAWKFGNIKVQTTIKDIVWQLGSSGRITPVGIVEPVDICGATIQRVSVHNIDIFETFDMRKGDTIVLTRANDVIPFIVSVVSHTDNPKFEIPKECPICGGKTKIDGKFLVCDNVDCRGKIVGDVLTWCQKLELKGISDATIETLVAHEFVTDPSDLYGFNAEQLRNFVGFGPRQSEKICEIINSKKEVTLPEFIGGLNLPSFGSRMTEVLIDAGYDTLDKIMNMCEEQLVSIKGIEVKTARVFLKGIASKKEVIQNLFEAGITIKTKEKKIMAKKAGSVFDGESFCFTGKVETVDENGDRYTRDRLQQLVYENGGSCEDSVKAGLTYLVQADPTSTSSKTQKANKLGVNILSEKDFFKMIGM